ncbi:divergent polysaccharide deacetylase family protein [Zavarzinia compransoris]|uniref:divergent polysaccharide deacetylase family protein n=1 Tax=Zavarzinia marina TaxID=2911065 RepID=UPI001F240843|nr:divergent polysaccharide deacetylase family protein [Zavarzinia marina]MCF4166975.1 divergent polysaccharide deacetylase family protein [Zavarzinia marina]
MADGEKEQDATDDAETVAPEAETAEPRRPPVLAFAVLGTVAAVGALVAWAALSGPGGAGREGRIVVRIADAPTEKAPAEDLVAGHETPAVPEGHGSEATQDEPAGGDAEHGAVVDAPEPPAAGHDTPSPAEPAETHAPATAPGAEPNHDADPGHDAAPVPAADVALAPAPDPRLVERGRDGSLPVIGPDGRQPWRVYARPFGDHTARPRVAIVVAGLGLRESTSTGAIETLPPDVTLAFSPYARNLDDWAAKARRAGHEFLIQVPMEPVDFPTSDPGPKALMTDLSAADNRSRLEWSLSRTTGYVGVMTYMGSRFTADAAAVRPAAEALRARGLMVLDSRTADTSVLPEIAGEIGLPRAVATRFIDATPTRAAVDARLAELERFARQGGAAIGIAADYPGSIERIAAWSAGLADKGLVLAPVSALADTVTLPDTLPGGDAPEPAAHGAAPHAADAPHPE